MSENKIMTSINELQSVIERAYDKRSEITPQTVKPIVKDAVAQAITGLDSGVLRVAEKQNGIWTVNEWLKKAVLLSFRINENQVMNGSCTKYYDKVISKFTNYDREQFDKGGFRIVPPAAVRDGAYIAPDVVVMPSFINIGAYIDQGTMIDTWATVGSCAQVGKNVHISGGAGLGGVLEPLQAQPTIIEDNCFIGARSEIVEGVIVEEGSVISMGVFIGQSTKILNRATGEITYGKIPAGSVVVAGNLPAKDGNYSLYCAVIVKQVDEKTRSKVSLNELLRDI